MALHRKFDALLSLRPDIAVIAECAKPEILQQRMDFPLILEKTVWVGSNPNKGLAVFAFNDYKISLSELYEPEFRFVAPILVEGPAPFRLIAAWAQNANDNIRRKNQPGPVRLAMDRYRNLLEQEPAILAGDLNNNNIWDKPGWPMNHADAVELLQSYNLVSAYHEVSEEAQGSETVPTHYWRDRKKDGPKYHIDYIFVPRPWFKRMTEFNVGTFEDWCGSGLSDHVPLIIDLDV
jgi:exodeoxyribonuclease-3